MNNSVFFISIPEHAVNFNLKIVTHFHGWVFLKPFHWNDKKKELSRCDKLSTKKAVEWKVFKSGGNDNKISSLKISVNKKITDKEKEEIQLLATRILNLSLDLSPFYQKCELDSQLVKMPLLGGGRFLRGGSFFEDAVKTLCTTNISWAGTKKMVSNLVEKIGNGSFPTWNDIIAFSEKRIKEEIGLGYRAQYLWDFCISIAENRFNLNYFESEQAGEKEVIKSFKKINGFGDYAINHILVLLNQFGRIPVDSEVKEYCTKVLRKRKLTDKSINNHFKKWGNWKFLAYKCQRISNGKNFIDDNNNDL